MATSRQIPDQAGGVLCRALRSVALDSPGLPCLLDAVACHDGRVRLFLGQGTVTDTIARDGAAGCVLPQDLREISGGLMVVAQGAEGRLAVTRGAPLAFDAVPDETALFAGMNAALAFRISETPAQVAAWLAYMADQQRLQAALIVNRIADAGFAAALALALGPSNLRVVLLDVPLPLGKPGLGPENHLYLAPDAPGKDRMTAPDPDPWRAPLGEGVMYEALKWHFLATARAVLTLDISDILAARRAECLRRLSDRAWRCRRAGGAADLPVAGAQRQGGAVWRPYLPPIRQQPGHCPLGRGPCKGGSGKYMAHGPGGLRQARDRMRSSRSGGPWRSGCRGDKARTGPQDRRWSRMRPCWPWPMLLGHKPDPPAGHRNARRPACRCQAAGRTAIVTTMKNEGPFILEWLAYHRAIGVDDFLIYTNDCTDGTDTMLDAAAGQGHRAAPRQPCSARCDLKPQHAALQAAEDEPVMQDCGWGICMDVDEFINIKIGDGTLAALYAAMGDANMICTDLAAVWQCRCARL